MFSFNFDTNSYKQIHFIGIGGISMSGLAEILLTKGFKISGTDSKESTIIEHLKDLGAKIFLNHKEDNIKGADLIIYTDAISEDNVELRAAKNSNIPTVDRASFLGAIMKNYTYSIAVSGTHGKTTTTSMIASITNHDTLNPTVLLGGQLDDIGGNVKLGSNDYILTEACEYKANILKYFPTMAIVLNIDEDHLDFFRDMDHIIDTFKGYANNLEEGSYLIINADDANTQNIINGTKAKVITFGIYKTADYSAEEIVFSEDGKSSFILKINNKEYYPVSLKVTGHHNVYNALASIAAAHLYGVPIEKILNYISLYNGVHRRLEYKGTINGVRVMDDYAHHPTEIRATLEALKNYSKSKVYCVFQPHTYTRTKALLDSFSEAFTHSDEVIITDIYAARENDNGEVHSKDLVHAVKSKGSNATYLSTFDEVEEYLKEKAEKNDIILTMGAGNVYEIGESILNNEVRVLQEKTAV